MQALKTSLDIRSARFLILDPRDQSDGIRPYLMKAYALWKELWFDTFKVLDGADVLTSDGFTRQHAIGLLLCGDHAVGCVSLSAIDLSSPIGRDDSCFSAWPTDLLVSLGSKYSGPVTLVASYMTLSPLVRGKIGPSSAKQLLGALVCEYFHDMHFDAMLATVRVDRGMHELCYNLNAQPVHKGLKMHGVEVDLVVWEREKTFALRKHVPAAGEARRIFEDGKAELIRLNQNGLMPKIVAA